MYAFWTLSNTITQTPGIQSSSEYNTGSTVDGVSRHCIVNSFFSQTLLKIKWYREKKQ